MVRRSLLIPCIFAACALVALVEPALAGKKPARSAGQDGIGSFYGSSHSKALTAAHRTLPFGTLVKVTNRKNGKSVVVRINDRGPFTKGRVIDVSYAAARQLGMISSGLAPVHLTVVPPPEKRPAHEGHKPARKPTHDGHKRTREPTAR